MTLPMRWRAAGAVGFSLLAFTVGALTLSRIDTDTFSEQQAYFDARSMLAGNHRWGIVSYAHYPNGPSYLLLPFMRLGMSRPISLRYIPLTLSAVAWGGFMWVCLGLASTASMAGLSLLYFAVVLLQPGLFAWQGALHEHSYAFSVLLGLLVAAFASRRPHRCLYGVAGFFAGWIGYDPFFLWLFSFITARWFRYNFEDQGNLKDRFLWTSLDGFAFVLGFGCAVGLHLVQNALFFGNFTTAVKDLSGAAALRLGVAAGAYQEVPMRPQHWTFIRMPFTMTLQFLYSFSRGGTFRQSAGLNAFTTVLLLPALLGSCIAILKAYQRLSEEHSNHSGALKPLRQIISVGLLGIVAANYAWFIVMPEHSVFHQIFLPRHLFGGVLFAGLLPLLIARLKGPTITRR